MTGPFVKPAAIKLLRGSARYAEYEVTFEVISENGVEFAGETMTIKVDDVPYSGVYKLHEASESESAAGPIEGHVKYELTYEPYRSREDE